MVDATALGAVVEIRVGSSPSISKYITESPEVGSSHGPENRSNRKVNRSMRCDSANLWDVISVML